MVTTDCKWIEINVIIILALIDLQSPYYKYFTYCIEMHFHNLFTIYICTLIIRNNLHDGQLFGTSFIYKCIYISLVEQMDAKDVCLLYADMKYEHSLLLAVV